MRILLVVLPQSPHSPRLANILVDGGWEVHAAAAYPSDLLPAFSSQIIVHTAPTDSPSGELRGRVDQGARLAGAGDGDPSVPGLPRSGGSRIPNLDGVDIGAACESVVPGSSRRAFWLAELVDTVRPDVIYSSTIQQASYLTLAAKLLCRRPFPPWIASNWGIDIHFYGQLESHRKAIQAVLANCDYYTAECRRDVELARILGFSGTEIGVAPIGGGYDVRHLRRLRHPGPTSSRRLIMVKGYQNLVGRALVALRAIALCADALRGYRVAIYLSNPDVAHAAELLEYETGIPTKVLPHVAHDHLMRHHGQARISVGLSLSDGISASALEAMIMGAFPVQSHTSCLDEWIRDGKTGILVHPEDPDEVAAAIRRSVADDELVDAAAVANDRTVDERLDAAILNQKVLAMFGRVTEDLGYQP